LREHYSLYGDYLGVRTARKHVGWYLKGLPGARAFLDRMNVLEDCQQQLDAVSNYFDYLQANNDRLEAQESAIWQQNNLQEVANCQ